MKEPVQLHQHVPYDFLCLWLGDYSCLGLVLQYFYGNVLFDLSEVVRGSSAACRWSIMEAEEYLQYLEGVIQQRNKMKWRLDTSWLQSKGIEVPDMIKAE